MNDQNHGWFSRVTIKSNGTEMTATDTQVSDTLRVKYMRERYTGCKIKLTPFAHFNRRGLVNTLKSKGICLNLKTVYVDHIGKSDATMTVTKE